LFRLIGAYAAVGLLMTLAAAPAVGIMAWATSTNTWVLYPVGWIAGVAACAACVVIGIRFCLVGPAIVAEDIGVVAGLNRALALSRGRSLDFFLACLVMGVVTFGLNAVSSVMIVVPFVGLIGQLVVTVTVSSLQSVFFFLLYAGARDLEGLSITTARVQAARRRHR
jgi:hypothetical protein